jgi:hypothetical protein
MRPDLEGESKTMKNRVLWCSALVAAASSASMADSVLLTPAHDNTLYEDSGGALSNANGLTFIAGTTQSRDAKRRGLVQFDVSSIPAGSTITGVDLQLFCEGQSAANSTPAVVSLHRALASWGEGTSVATPDHEGGGAPSTTNDATWIHRFYPSVSWVNAGGDFDPSASASLTVGNAGLTYDWSSAGLIADVQSWVNGGGNFGWLVLGDESFAGSARAFSSREDHANKPLLTVTYVPAPASAGVLLGALGLAGRRRRG